VRGLARREGATLFMVLLAAFAVLLRRWSGREDLLLGTHVANRIREEVERVIGFFVNNLVLRIDLAGDPSFRALLARVREICLAAYAHQDLPFGTLVQAVRPERALSRTPLVQVLFVLQNTPEWRIEAEGVELSFLPLPEPAPKFDLTLFVFEREDDLDAILEYDTDLFEAATIERLAEQLRHLLTSAVETPGAPLSMLSAGDTGAGELLLHGFTRQLEEI
jgi:non-ribosomal peptide synthetase component F